MLLILYITLTHILQFVIPGSYIQRLITKETGTKQEEITQMFTTNIEKQFEKK
jgi:hypothetical protein